MTADAVGGVWQYALDLARDHALHGIETVLAVLGPAPDPAQVADAEKAGIRLVVTGLPLDWTAPSASAVEEAGWAVARLATETEPDLVHLNAPALAAAALFPAPVVTVAHSCVATWWEANRTEPLPLEFAWQRDLTRRGYNAADAVTAPTRAFAEATAAAYGLASPPLVVRNGRRAASLPPLAGDPFVFTAGRLWDDGKNLATLDRAAARLSLPVLAAGPLDGPNGARVALDRIRALGRLDDRAVAERLAARPIFASLARYEPFGLAVLEAAQAGCPLVLSDISTFRELWDGAAAFVPADDDAAAAAAIEALARDPDARARLGDAARDRASRYTVEAMGRDLRAVYRSLLDPSRARPRAEDEAA